MTGSSRPEFTLGLKVYLIAVAFATIVPPAFLYSPSSNRWFAAFPRQKGFGIGCGTLIVLLFVGMMASMIDVGHPESLTVITANVDPAGLPREWDGVTHSDKQLDLKPLEGVEPLHFGDKAIVIIRKSGAAHVVKRKYMTRKHIFGDKPFKLGLDTYFLTPIGRR